MCCCLICYQQEDALSQLIRNATYRATSKIQQETNSTSFHSQITASIQTFQQETEALEAERLVFISAYHKRLQLESKLYSLISQEEFQQKAIEEFLQTVENIVLDPDLVTLAKKIVKNLKVKDYMSNIQEAIESFDAIQLKKHYEIGQQQNLHMEQQLIDQIEDILEEAEENPNYMIDKQNEMKKRVKPQGKGKR